MPPPMDCIFIMVSSLIYGTYMVMSIMSLCFLFRHGSQYPGRHLTIAYTMFMTAVVTIWFTTASIATTDELMTESLLDIACQSPNITAKISGTLQILGGDALLLYRAFVIWNGDKRVMVPLTLLFALTLITALLHDCFCVPSMYEMITGSVTFVFIAAFFAFNISGLGLVTYKLWRMNRALKQSGYANRQVAGKLSVLAQMAALYMLLAGFMVPMLVSKSVFTVVVEQVAQYIVILLPAIITFAVALRVYSNSIRVAARKESHATALAEAEKKQLEQGGLGTEYAGRTRYMSVYMMTHQTTQSDFDQANAAEEHDQPIHKPLPEKPNARPRFPVDDADGV